MLGAALFIIKYLLFGRNKNNQNRLSCVGLTARLGGVGAFCRTPAVCAAWLN